MKRSEKVFLVDNLVQEIKDAKSVTVLDYQGLGTHDLDGMRQAIKEAGGHMVVVKNTLLERAIKAARGTRATRGTGDTLPLTGPTAVVFAQGDEVAPLQEVAKVIAEKEKPKLKFGIFYGEILSSEKITTLSKLPGKNTLIGQLLGNLAGPMYGLVGTLNGNLQSLVFILDQKAKIK